jgi:hypothetical protein
VTRLKSSRGRRLAPMAAGEHAHVLLRRQHLERFGGDLGRDDDLDELAFDDGPGGRGVEFAVEGDDAAEGGFRIGLVGAVVGLEQVAPKAPRRRDWRA